MSLFDSIDPEEYDHTDLGKKVLQMYKVLEEVSTKELQKFNYAELMYLQENYGLSLVYPVFKDVSEILREPASSDMVH